MDVFRRRVSEKVRLCDEDIKRKSTRITRTKVKEIHSDQSR